jgi:hypothetical protein
MRTVIGAFKDIEQADRAARDLKQVISHAEQVRLLSPESDRLKYDDEQVTDTVDRRGFGIALGGIVLGVIAVIACFLMFGSPFSREGWRGFVSPIVAVLVVGGALLGAWLGSMLFDPYAHGGVQGLSYEEFFYYHDALQRGEYIVTATTMNEQRAVQMRKLLQQLGADSYDTVREQWWAGLRDSEAAFYQDNEAVYRTGFEAALNPENFGHSYDEALPMLRARHDTQADQEFFRRGYERGQQYVMRQHVRRAA